MTRDIFQTWTVIRAEIARHREIATYLMEQGIDDFVCISTLAFPLDTEEYYFRDASHAVALKLWL